LAQKSGNRLIDTVVRVMRETVTKDQGTFYGAGGYVHSHPDAPVSVTVNQSA
jgi:hypothetical protein